MTNSKEHEIKPIDDRRLETLAGVLKDPQTIFIYDIDGILADSPKEVFQRFNDRAGTNYKPHQNSRFDYLTSRAIADGLDSQIVDTAEDGWYDSKVLRSSDPVLYARSILYRTIYTHGADRNYVLTARLPRLENTTMEWFSEHFPKVPQDNILVRVNHESEVNEDFEIMKDFKVSEITRLSKIASNIVFVEDSVGFSKAVIKHGPDNCYIINIPMGEIHQDLQQERLFVFDRIPLEKQGLLPLMMFFKENLIEKAN